MELGTLSSWIAAGIAIISTGITLWLQWWKRPTVEWMIDGSMGMRGAIGDQMHERGFPIHLVIANVGDGTAYGVETIRCNGGNEEPFTVFESAAIPGGGQFEITLSVTIENLPTAWVEVGYTSSPTLRTKRKHSRRLFPAQELLAPSRRRPNYDPTQPRLHTERNSRIPDPIAKQAGLLPDDDA